MGVKALMKCMLILMLLASDTFAQTVQRTTFEEADKIFLNKNLYLLASHLNIDAQKALEIQSRAYPNPTFSAELNAIDPQSATLFHVNSTGEKVFAFEQLIVLGGKRKNEIAIAKQNTKHAELELEDLLRNLKLQLHTSLYSVYFDGITLLQYNSQLGLLDTIIGNYEIQAQKGNISLKEVVRLKSVYLKINNERSELLLHIHEQQKNLQVLLQTTNSIEPDIAEFSWEKFDFVPPLDSLSTLALANRADWKLAEINSEIATLNLKYQKSLAVPDLSLGSSYDQRGGAFNNQVNMTVGFPIPLWNRNRGNIRFAESTVQSANINKSIRQTEINAEVWEAWSNMQRSIQEYQKSKQMYTANFNAVFDGITDNFKKRNISIIEFVDFFESYNESLAEINRIRKQLSQSAESVNYTSATPIYKN